MGRLYDEWDKGPEPKSWEEMQEWLESLQERYKSLHPWAGPPNKDAWKARPCQTIECVGGEFHGRRVVGVFKAQVASFCGGDRGDVYELIGHYHCDDCNKTIHIAIAVDQQES